MNRATGMGPAGGDTGRTEMDQLADQVRVNGRAKPMDEVVAAAQSRGEEYISSRTRSGVDRGPHLMNHDNIMPEESQRKVVNM
jgi:hypothetical protein